MDYKSADVERAVHTGGSGDFKELLQMIGLAVEAAAELREFTNKHTAGLRRGGEVTEMAEKMRNEAVPRQSYAPVPGELIHALAPLPEILKQIRAMISNIQTL